MESMIVEHYDDVSKTRRILQDEVRFAEEPTPDDARRQYEYWSWRLQYLKKKCANTPRCKERQSLALERDRAQLKFNQAKGRLFG